MTLYFKYVKSLFFLITNQFHIHYEEHFIGGFHPLTEILNRFIYKHELCFDFEKIIKDNDEFYHNITNIKNFNLLISAKDYDYTDYDIISPGYITIFYKDFYKYLISYIDYRIMV